MEAKAAVADMAHVTWRCRLAAKTAFENRGARSEVPEAQNAGLYMGPSEPGSGGTETLMPTATTAASTTPTMTASGPDLIVLAWPSAQT